MTTSTKIVAEQIGMLVLANAEQASLIEELKKQLDAMRDSEPKKPPPTPVTVSAPYEYNISDMRK